MKSSILIVDDSPYLHKLIRTYLEGDSLDIHSVYDGAEAISAVVKIRPNLILLDVDMPIIDGFEVCRRLKANPATDVFPIIFLTAEVSPGTQIKGLDLGAIDYMTKRFKPDELRSRIHSALQLRPGPDDASMVDGLTKLWNASYLHRHLTSQLSLARRMSRPLSCIMGNLDGLRSINRRYGETVGDDVVRAATQIVASHGRTEDMVCYLGDGKFALLLPGTDEAGASHLAERIRIEIERQLKSFNGENINATCSFGLADTGTGADQSLLDRADAALNCAKRSGRNCISISKSANLAMTG